MTRIVVVGEALVDIVDGVARPGGSPLNVAVGLGRLGFDVELFTRVGSDEYGLTIMEHLAASHVHLASDSVADGRTSVARAHIEANGSAGYEFDITWDVMIPSLAGADIVHVGSLGAYIEPGASRVLAAIKGLSSTTLVTFDPNIRPALIDDREVAIARTLEVFERSNVVKLSDEDAEYLFPGASIDDVLQRITSHGPRLAVITRAERGCSARAGDETFELPAVATTVVDTIGAGDAFMSGVIAAIARMPEIHASHVNWRAALTVALNSSAVTVSRPGADPPQQQELPALDEVRRASWPIEDQ